MPLSVDGPSSAPYGRGRAALEAERRWLEVRWLPRREGQRWRFGGQPIRITSILLKHY